jgi:uroporphyrinogen-III synthase
MTHWISYSEPTASRLAQMLSAMGQATLCHPVTRIQWLSLDAPIPDIKPDLIVALSQHAVAAYLSEHYRPSHHGANVIAIGPTTAKGLIDTGNFVVELPQQASSEGLLAMPALQNLGPNQTVWLLTGEGGRDLVVSELADRCKFSRFDLYRRQPSAPATLPVASLQSIWIGSLHGLQQVTAEADKLAIDRQCTTLVLPSQRVADHAKRLGWYKLLVCEGIEPQQVRQTCDRIEHD